MALTTNVTKDNTLDALVWNTPVISCSPRGPSSFTQTEHTGSPLTFWLSLIHMHAWRNTQHSYTHTHMQDRALTAHPLSGTQQGGHVLESEGATSLQQLLHTLFILRDIYQCRLVALLTIRVCISTVCLCGRACQTHWNRSFCDKRSFSRQSSDVSIYGAHAWPVLTLVFPSAKRSVWDEVISFPSHGRLGDQNIRWALQSPSICGVCFHL